MLMLKLRPVQGNASTYFKFKISPQKCVVTVQFDQAVRFTERVLGHAAVRAKVGWTYAADLQLHVLGVAGVLRHGLELVPGAGGICKNEKRERERFFKWFVSVLI